MRKIKLSLCCVFAGTLLLGCAFITARAEQKAISEKLIRLHVIANSDSDEDQSVKLMVRDAVIELLDEKSWTSVEEAQSWISSHLSLLQDTAEKTLVRAGNDNSVKVSLTREEYPTRDYDSFSLPAGEYWSLKIVIGQGQGKNWWCVVYPSLCRKASGAMETVAVSAGFTRDEVQFITEDTIPIKIKFKILEIFKKFRLFS